VPVSEWSDLLTQASARKKTLDSDPSSPTYGDETTGEDFAAAYQKMSSTEVQRVGRAYGTEMYVLLVDLAADGTVPVGKADTLNVDGVGDLNVTAIIDYQQADQRMARVEAEVVR
jgi:hypothetical protein